MNEKFLKLITALITPYPHHGDPIEDKKFTEFQTDCLKELWKLRKHRPALSFLAAINYKDETNEWRLREAHRLAKQLLPGLLRQKQEQESESEMTRFQRERANLDPFVDTDTNFTKDAYSGQMPADDVNYTFDSRGNIVNK
jgi:hypothetical protein